MKRCSKCGQDKDDAEFYVSRAKKSGLTCACIACQKTPRKAMYDVWRGMLGRCYDPQHISYPHYGAKGVIVCDVWRNSFDVFCRDMGKRPSGMTIERENSALGYEPGNCRWATVTEQNNNKSDTRLITWSGKTQNMTAWAKELGMSAAALHYRIAKMGLSIEAAFTIPVTRMNRHGRFGEIK